ncbi:hypothetical protein HDU96_003728 [Phlyctochytrium bullatum]|nr:hypothetical protein HDU96_003728 [Phlyctochytrium bullatum]
MILDHSFAAARLGIPGVDTSAYHSRVLRTASESGNVDVVKLLLDHSFAAVPLGLPHVNPSAEDSYALRTASRKGYTEIVKLLLDHSRQAIPLGMPCVDPSAIGSEALRSASCKGHSAVVKLLLDHSLEVAPLGLPCSDPSALDSESLRTASWNRHADVVKLLLDHSLKPRHWDSLKPVTAKLSSIVSVLYSATKSPRCCSTTPWPPQLYNEYLLELVALLLDHRRQAKPMGIPCVDPAFRDNEALCLARESGNEGMVKLLEEYELEE